ncbi:MAG: hypothetical protein NVS3B25_01390 [Hymenobacter sp.]
MTGPLNRASRLVRWFVQPFAGQEPSFYRAITACLLAACLFWQMNALNKTYTTRLDLALAWHYDSAHYVPLRPLPHALPVTVTGLGWHLLRANLGWGTHPADLRPVPLPGTRYLPADAWHRGLQSALEGIQVNEWAGDTLRLTFDRYASRRLALALPPDSARRYAAHFTPTMVTFHGPASLVNALPDPYPLAPPYPPASRDDEVELEMKVPPRVHTSVPTVRLRREPRPLPAVQGRHHRASFIPK